MEICYDFRSTEEMGGRQQALQHLDRLVAFHQQILGHELPNFLISIHGLARTLERELPEGMDETFRSLLNRIGQAAREADILARRAATLTRMIRTPPSREQVRLDELLGEVAAEVKLQGGGKPFDLAIQAPMPEVIVPLASLRLVLLELVRNAAEAPCPGSPHLDAFTQLLPGEVELILRDNGKGLPEEDAGRLFEPFQSRRNPQRQSGGLGLFTVLQLTASWRGALRIRSIPDKGTEVTLVFPTGPTEEGDPAMKGPHPRA